MIRPCHDPALPCREYALEYAPNNPLCTQTCCRAPGRPIVSCSLLTGRPREELLEQQQLLLLLLRPHY